MPEEYQPPPSPLMCGGCGQEFPSVEELAAHEHMVGVFD